MTSTYRIPQTLYCGLDSRLKRCMESANDMGLNGKVITNIQVENDGSVVVNYQDRKPLEGVIAHPDWFSNLKRSEND